jgi:hypothetical protein
MSDKRMQKWRLDSVFVFIGMFLIGWVRLPGFPRGCTSGWMPPMVLSWFWTPVPAHPGATKVRGP